MHRDTTDLLIQAMQQPCFYDHPVEQVELIETHISWIFLAGDYAYKLKKPVNFGFLDFSSLAKRQHYCQEELRLNRRFAPQLYLTVKTIGGDPSAPALKSLPPLEYAVKMRRFAQQAQLDQLLAAGKLNFAQLGQLAVLIAKVHQAAAVAQRDSPFGSPESIMAPIKENFAQIRPLLPKIEHGQLTELEKWSHSAWQRLQPVLHQRKAAGFIRECHGDLHLANMAWFEEQPLLFDCIEFNENLRWIDVINDIAFLVMDLDDRGQQQLGWCFLNHYLQETGDYQGVKLLSFYLVYRAMVRAKVLCLRLQQPGLTAAERTEDLARYQSYLELASNYIDKPAKVLIISHGLSGSGKTSVARELAAACGAIHLQSDRERKRLSGLAATADSYSPIAGGIYRRQAHTATYERLRQLAEQVLCAGYSVIIDATFLHQQQREQVHELAIKLDVPLLILDFIVPEIELRRRIQQRAASGDDASEANLAVLDHQLTQQQPLRLAEQQLTVVVTADTSPTEIAAQIAARITRRLSENRDRSEKSTD